MVDIIIVGAGPVGSWLAGSLARSGRQVVVLEAKPAAGTGICCTGIISSSCYERYVRQTGVSARPAGEARLVSPGGSEIRVCKEPPPACIIDRPALDSALASRALEAGAEYHFQSRVSNIGQSDTGCTVNYRQHDEMRELRSRALVIASGFSSDLPRRAGLGQISDYRAGAQVDLEMVTTEVEVYFEPDLFPGGFGWLVPTWGGRGLAGVVATRQAGAALDVFLRRMNTQRKIGLKLSETRHKALPLRPLSRTSNRRIIAVGEAAGQVKATTFGGIYSGLIAAEKAADALEKALAENTWAAKPLFGYDRAWRLAMSEDLKRGWHVRRFYDALSSNQVDRAFSLVKSAGLDRQLLNSKDFSFDWHGALLARLLLKPRLMAGLFSIDTLAALPDLLALARSPKRHD